MDDRDTTVRAAGTGARPAAPPGRPGPGHPTVLDDVLAIAPQLVPEPPEDLADRMITRLRAAIPAPGTGGGTMHPRSTEPAPHHHVAAIRPIPRTRPAATRVLGVAAAAILLVGSLAVAAGPRPGNGERPLRALLAAANATAGVTSARVHIAGTAQTDAELTKLPELPAMSLPKLPELPPASLPPLPELPPASLPKLPELPELPAAAPQPATPGMPEATAPRSQPPTAAPQEPGPGRQAPADELRRQFDDAQAGIRAVLAQLPRRFHARWTFEGSGTLQVPGRVEIQGDARLVESDPPATSASGKFHVVVDAGSVFTQNPDGTFTESAGATGPLGRVVADPEGVARLLRSASGTSRDLGLEQLDGQPVRHYRFDTDAAGVGAPEGTRGTFTVDAWIGERDHIARKVVLRAEGASQRDGMDARWSSETTIEITHVGAPVSIEVPPASRVTPAAPGANAVASILSPYGSAVPLPVPMPAGVSASR